MQRRRPLPTGEPPVRRTPLDRGAPRPRRQRDTGPDRTVRQAVQDRSHGRCEVRLEWCTGQAGHVHHRRPRRMGGSRDEATNRPPNLIAACPDCHEYIESHRTLGYELGLLLRDEEIPEETPVTLGSYGPVYLTDDGGVRPLGEDSEALGWSQ